MEIVERSTRSVLERADGLIRQFATRDNAASVMRSVREGDFEALAPGSFNEDYPAPIIANRIDTMARDMMATLSTMPSFNCVPTSDLKDNAKKFAAKRTQIAKSYVEGSNLQAQLPEAADSLNTYGVMAFVIEPDWKCKSPKIYQVDGASVYPVWDKNLRTVECVHITWVSIYTLEAHYPDHAAHIRQSFANGNFERIRVARYESAKELLAYLPEYGNMVLAHQPNRLGRCSYVTAPRPTGRGSWSAVPRGAYDDLVWPLIAANDFRVLALEGVAKTVQAPIVTPPDVNEIAWGPDAVIHTNNPQSVKRVDVNIPPAAFTAGEVLDRDMQVGGMSPGSRTGNINASVITGRGVDALGEGYSGQTAMLQTRMAWVLKEAIALCFEMDEKFWPNEVREIRGESSESPFSLKYTPSKDIKGDYTVEVDYGFLLGLDANRALVFILQAHGAGLISTATAGRFLPIPLNLEEESSRIQLEQLRNSLIQGVAALAQAIPQMVIGGQDPASVVAAMADAAERVKKGEPIEEALAKVFAPQPPPAPAPAAPADPAAAALGGSEPGGLQHPDLATEGPNARPDMAQMFAGLTSSGSPNLGAMISRMAPAAGGR